MGDDSRAEDVGSVAEEAGKLFGALRDWAAREGGASAATAAYQEAAASAAAGAATWWQEAGEHLHHGVPTSGAAAAECHWCPVCRVAAAWRGTSPEVRAHLGAAASSLVQAAAGLLDTPVPDRARRDHPGSGSPRAQEPEDPSYPGDGDRNGPGDPGTATWEDD